MSFSKEQQWLLDNVKEWIVGQQWVIKNGYSPNGYYFRKETNATLSIRVSMKEWCEYKNSKHIKLNEHVVNLTKFEFNEDGTPKSLVLNSESDSEIVEYLKGIFTKDSVIHYENNEVNAGTMLVNSLYIVDDKISKFTFHNISNANYYSTELYRPSIGDECMYICTDGGTTEPKFKCKVLGYWFDLVWIYSNDLSTVNHTLTLKLNTVIFKPLPTEEELAIDEMVEHLKELCDKAQFLGESVSQWCKLLYKAGYRKC